MANMVLFSPVIGVVMNKGAPVAGATIERQYRWGWKDETGIDSTTTDSGGNFRFPEIDRSSFFGAILPHEISVEQEITIRHGGKSYRAWVVNKTNYDLNGEIGRPIRITCRLENEAHRKGAVFGICEIT